MPPSPKNQNKRDFPGRRWLSIALRSLHLVGVVLVGAALLGGGERTAAGLLMLLTGVGLYGIELWCNPKHLGELAGVFGPLGEDDLLLLRPVLADAGEELHRPMPDQTVVARMKKEKLRLKEEIERLRQPREFAAPAMGAA